jgi:preprotein translocase subunit SecG
MVVPDNFGGGNMVVTYDILTTQWSSLGHESSLSLSESSQCRQFQSRKSPELFKSSLRRNFIAKMTYFFASCLSCSLICFSLIKSAKSVKYLTSFKIISNNFLT